MHYQAHVRKLLILQLYFLWLFFKHRLLDRRVNLTVKDTYFKCWFYLLLLFFVSPFFLKVREDENPNNPVRRRSIETIWYCEWGLGVWCFGLHTKLATDGMLTLDQITNTTCQWEYILQFIIKKKKKKTRQWV